MEILKRIAEASTLLDPYPPWLKSLIVVWTFFTAALLLCLVFVRPPATAPIRVTGRVVEKNSGRPVPSAAVELKIDEKVTPAVTDSEGKFKIKLPSGQVPEDATVRISASGYKSQDIHIDVPKGTTAKLPDVQLHRDLPVEARKLVLVLDSEKRKDAVGEIVRTLQPLIDEHKLVVTPTLITTDQSVIDQIALLRPVVVIAHAHAFEPVVDSTNSATNRLLEQFEAFAEQNPNVRYIVYSGAFTTEGEGELWLDNQVAARTAQGGQLGDYHPPYLDRIKTIGLPAVVPFGQETRARLRTAVREAVQATE